MADVKVDGLHGDLLDQKLVIPASPFLPCS